MTWVRLFAIRRCFAASRMPPTASAFACGSASATPPQGGSDTQASYASLKNHSPLEGESARPTRRPFDQAAACSRAGGGPTRRPESEARSRAAGGPQSPRFVRGPCFTPACSVPSLGTEANLYPLLKHSDSGYGSPADSEGLFLSRKRSGSMGFPRLAPVTVIREVAPVFRERTFLGDWSPWISAYSR